MADVNLQVQVNLLENINATLKGINSSFDKFANTAVDNVKEVESGFSKLTKSFNTVGIGIIELNQGLELVSKAYRTLIPLIKKSISEAAEQEKVESFLSNTMKQRGILTQDLYKQNLRLADSLQTLSTYQDDEILNAERILLQLGVEQTQLEATTKATMDFATAKGMDLSSASELVAKSIGTSTNALKRYGIEIDSSLKGTARAAAIVGELNRVFGVSATAATNTFSGSLSQHNNIWKELLEQFGNYIVRNPFVIAAIKEISKFLTDATKIISDNKDSMISLVNNGIIFMVDGFITLIKIIKDVPSALDSLKVAFYEFQTFAFAIIRTIATPFTLLGEIGAKAGIKLAKEFADFGTIVDSAAKDAQTSIIKINNSANESSKIFDPLLKNSEELRNKLLELSKTPINLKAQVELVVKKDAGGLQSFMSAFELAAKNLIDFAESLTAKDILSAISGGKGGAQKLLGQAIGAAVGSPEIGQAAQILGLDPAEFSKVITGFLEGLTTFIPNIARNIPTLINAVIASIPDLIRGINEAIPILIEGLVTMLSDPKFWERVITAAIEIILLLLGNPMFWINIAMALVKAIILGVPAIIAALVQGIANSIGKAFENIGKVFADAVKVFADAINVFKDAVNGVGDFFGKVGKGASGVFGSTKKFLGLAEGGTVPTSPAYSNDKFGPVMLSGGENVMDYSTNRRLNEYLDTQASQERTVNINLQVGEKDLASVMLALNQRGFRTA